MNDTRLSSAVHALVLVSQSAAPMSSEQIATSVGTNASYVRKIMASLGRAGIVEGLRRSGGFTLLRPASELTLLDVYRAVEGTGGVHVFDVHRNPNDECIVGRHIQPVMSEVFGRMEERLARELAGVTLADCIKQLEERADQAGEEW